MTSRPPFTSSTAATGTQAAVEAKAEEGMHRSAPMTRPAAGGSPTARPESTSPARARSAVAGSKAGEERICAAPETRPAPGEPQTGPEALVTASGPVTPTDSPSTRRTAIARETTTNQSGEQAVNDRLIKRTVDHLATRGIQAISEEDWTYQRALHAVRENRRRQADTPTVRAIGQWSTAFADDITKATSLAPADVAAVLLYASSWVGGLALIQGLGRDTSLSVLSCAADELDRRVNGGETP
jgi:hypothetical protein